MDYIIVVPSYNRVDIFKKKTLAFLKKHNIGSDKIFVFVANEEQKSVYNSPDYITIVGVLGLVPQRNYICNYFPANKLIVSFDDDVDDDDEVAPPPPRSAAPKCTAPWRRGAPPRARACHPQRCAR